MYIVESIKFFLRIQRYTASIIKIRIALSAEHQPKGWRGGLTKEKCLSFVCLILNFVHGIPKIYCTISEYTSI